MRNLRANHIAMIFQDRLMTLNPVLRIDTRMIETIKAHDPKVRDDVARARACDVLGQIGIPSPDDRLKAYPHQFSGGIRQRIGIARALAVKPEFLVCEEAIAALDVSIQAQVINLFMNLREGPDVPLHQPRLERGRAHLGSGGDHVPRPGRRGRRDRRHLRDRKPPPHPGALERGADAAYCALRFDQSA